MQEQLETDNKHARTAFADGPRLLADIGATHARFALQTAPGAYRSVRVLKCDEFDGIVPLLRFICPSMRTCACTTRRWRWPIRSTATMSA
jgi:hypothetical protein